MTQTLILCLTYTASYKRIVSYMISSLTREKPDRKAFRASDLFNSKNERSKKCRRASLLGAATLEGWF
jgi:hypothetical protein